MNESAVGLAQRLGRPVLFPAGLAPDRRFDVVTLWETLEHLPDPASILRDAARRLHPGGLLALTVPNLDSPAIRAMRSDSVIIHGGPAWPGHINLFTLGSLRRLLERCGFSIVEARGQYSTNLLEFIAWHLGWFDGARGYLRREPAEITLPPGLDKVLHAIAEPVAAWEEWSCRAPILRVTAGLSVNPSRTSGRESVQHRNAALIARLAERSPEPAVPPARRGTPVRLEQAEYRDPAVRPNTTNGLDVRGEASGTGVNLWTGPPLQVDANTWLVARGKLFRGGVSVGLLDGDRWGAQSSASELGAFEIAAGPVQAGEDRPVISNRGGDHGAEIDVVVDSLELVV